MFFLVCDGLKGLPEVVGEVWPATIVQACTVHLVRNSFRYVGRQHWDALKRDLKPIYTAQTAAAAEQALDRLDEKWGSKYPALIRMWRSHWAEFVLNRPGMSETASNGQLSGLLGCLLSVVRSFEFGGRDVAAVFVQAPVVEPIDPFGGRDLDLLDRFPGLAGFDQLGFVQPVDRFCQRIIV